jgi:hypothetical protein
MKGGIKDPKEQVNFIDSISEGNALHQMWKKFNVDESFYENYEQWLEDEVWSYYD